MHCGQMQKEIIAAGVIEGLPQSKIAAKIGMNQATVSRAINNDTHVKKLIEEGVQVLTNALPKAVGNLVHAANKFQDEMPKDYGKAELQMREFGYRSSERIMDLVGLGASHAQAPMIQKIFVQTNNFMTPIVNRAISMVIDDVADAEIIGNDE